MLGPLLCLKYTNDNIYISLDAAKKAKFILDAVSKYIITNKLHINLEKIYLMHFATFTLEGIKLIKDDDI